MAEAVDFDQGLGRRELETVRRRFVARNHDRLQRIQGELKPSQQEFLHLLPLLCHINHPLLPGFVSSDAPAGIPNYTPSARQLELARRHSRSFSYKRTHRRPQPIHALYLMGSVGSIGQSRASDLDIWLCHSPGLSAASLDNLAAKARLLEKWADDLGLEAHIFLMDVDDFRHGKLSSLSGESSGSTQHGLLLEEFYRSGLLLAGRYPLWWLVPPEHEYEYSSYAGNLIRKRFIDPGECLDFGGLGEIDESEFLGAALWQLFKGVHSPYKAVLKILLIEAYAQSFPQPEWLALQIKQAIYAGDVAMERLDAYLLMYRKVEHYLLGRGQQDRLELARRCLYFKVAEPMAQVRTKPGWRAEKMLALVKEWGWSQSQLRDLDSRAEWKIDRVSRERDQLVRELTRSYRLLTDFAAGQGEGMRVRPEELNLIGRQLYTSLEHRPGKVERVNPGISDNLSETDLSLHCRNQDGDRGWALYRGQVGAEEEVRHEPIKVVRSLTELLAWCQVNGIATAATHFHLYPQACPVSAREMDGIRQTLYHALPGPDVLEAPLSELARQPYPRGLMIFVNIGSDPREKQKQSGLHLISNRTDPLSYGSGRACLLTGLELLVHTSWGELVVQSHRDPEGLLDALCFFLDLLDRAPRNAVEPNLRVEGFATAEAQQLSRRVDQMFREARRFFHDTPHGRYVVGLGSRLYQVEQSERGFRWLRHETEQELLDTLSQPRGRYSPPGCDPQALDGSPLPVIFRHCRPGEQQLFYYCDRERTHLYVMDESGSLFVQDLSLDDPQFILLQQQRFLESLSRLRRLSGVTEEAATFVTGPRFYRLERHDGEWQALPARLPRRAGMDDYLELRLVAESSGQDVHVLSLVCGEREFSAVNLGGRLFDAVVHRIRQYRKGGDYPIYLTQVELIQDRYGIPPSGVELLALKKRVEQRLNQAQQRQLGRA